MLHQADGIRNLDPVLQSVVHKECDVHVCIVHRNGHSPTYVQYNAVAPTNASNTALQGVPCHDIASQGGRQQEAALTVACIWPFWPRRAERR